MRFLVENCSNKVMVTPTNPMHMGLPQTNINKQTNKQTAVVSHTRYSPTACAGPSVCVRCTLFVCLFGAAHRSPASRLFILFNVVPSPPALCSSYDGMLERGGEKERLSPPGARGRATLRGARVKSNSEQPIYAIQVSI